MSEETQVVETEETEVNEVEDVKVESSTTEAVSSETESEAKTDEPEGEEPKKDDLPVGVKKRFSELTRDKYQLRGENEQLKRKLDELEHRLQPKEPVKPKFSDYESDERYESALDQYYANKANHDNAVRAIQERQRQSQESIANQRADNQKAYNKRLSEQKAVLDNFEEVISDPAFAAIGNHYSQDIIDVILSSDKGPALSYYLATNLEEAERIASLPSNMAAFELARIESRIEIPKPKTVSNAPDPIKKASSKSIVEREISDPDISDEEFNTLRRKQIRSKGGRA